MQALWMIFGAFFFSSMAVGIKIASSSFSTFEILFYRGLVSLVLMVSVLRWRGTSMRTTVPLMHLWRSLVGVLAMSLWFYAIAHLPLPTAMTLNYMSSVWIAAFVVGGALIYGQPKDAQRQGPLMGSVLLGFIGVVLVLSPTIDKDQLFASVLGLLSGIGAALAFMQITALARVGEPEDRTVLYFSCGTTVAGGVGMLFGETTPWAQVRATDVAWVIPIGVLATLGQWCMTKAYSKGATLVVASLQYSGVIFATAYSLLLFGDHIAPAGWLGIGCIVTSGILATILRANALPNAPAEDH